ncbi:hypothetical protein ACQ4M4_21490 [Leptolyngbya sp. AN02str]|uniref:hypothetical protein n=1 Tax=Leptolyngbya sp. AN02str TaxID=3423363 RepID=UPI003D318DC7
MPVIESLFEFSRTNCVAICAFLVPANLLATLQTLIFVGLERDRQQIQLMTSAATVYASLMVLHVVTWFVIGVVMIPTFILSGLATVCLVISGWAIARPQGLAALLQRLVKLVLPKERSVWTALTR